MAYIGLKYFVFAPITAEADGADPTYSTGAVVGKAIGADVTWNHNDNILRADDGDAESDNSITGGTINIDMDDLPLATRAVILGGYTDSSDVYYDTAAPGPYGGFGYIREVRYNGGQTRFDAFWCYKTAFAMEDDSAQTLGESIEWQTPKLVGRIMGGQLANAAAAGHAIYRAIASFDTYAAAKAFINGKAGITGTNTNTQTGQTGQTGSP